MRYGTVRWGEVEMEWSGESGWWVSGSGGGWDRVGGGCVVWRVGGRVTGWVAGWKGEGCGVWRWPRSCS